MNILSGTNDFFGLDIGTSALRIVKLRGPGKVKVLEAYAAAAVEGNISVSDSKADQTKLAQAIKQLIKQAGISTSSVAVNLPSNRVFTTVIDMDKLSQAELAKTIKYQADSFIPTPLAESKIDWALLGESPKDKTKVEVLISSVSNAYIESRLDMLESIGLDVIAFEPDTFALTRSLVPPDVANPQLLLDMGHDSTDLVISMNAAPRLTRNIPIGSSTVIKSVMNALSIDATQATQFVYKFGLSKDKLEGQIYNAILPNVENLTDEIAKSINFFQDRYPNSKIERIVVTGGASTLPELPIFLANHFNLSVEIGNAWRNVSYPSGKQNELLSISNHFAVACGLAERDL